MRSVLPVFVLYASAEESLMQFEKSSDFSLSAERGNSRTHRLHQNTQAMEEEWKSILMNIAQSGSWSNPKTGNPWVPNKTGVLEPVQTVIEEMEDELKEQKVLNTDIMGNHTADVKTCNAVMNAAIKAAAANEYEAFKKSRTTHADCRVAENTQIEAMEKDCGVFNASNKCGHEQDWFAAYQESPDNKAAGSLAKIVDEAVECKREIGVTTKKAEECDGNQDTFTGNFCSYRCAVDGACSTHAECWGKARDGWNAANTSITALEQEQKTIYRMLQRIRCYLDLLVGKADGVWKETPPTAEDIAKCGEGTLKWEDQELDVAKGGIEAAATCYGHALLTDDNYGSSSLPTGGPNNGPGWPDFEATEFDSNVALNKHGQLQPIKAMDQLCEICDNR